MIAVTLRTLCSLTIAVAVSACATKSADTIESASKVSREAPGTGGAPQASASAVATAGKALGDPCVPSDGWEPPPPIEYFPGVDSNGSPYPAYRPGPGPQTFAELPPGVGYCNTGGSAPFWTSTCRAQSDCPAGWVCPIPVGQTGVSNLCAKGCRSDSDCSPDYLRPGEYRCEPPFPGVPLTCVLVTYCCGQGRSVPPTPPVPEAGVPAGDGNAGK